MKRDKLVTFPVSFLMACLLAFGAMGCMVSGLDLPVENPVLLYQIWAMAALAGCGLFLLRYGWAGMLVIMLVGLFWLWPHYHFSKPICAMITRLSAKTGSLILREPMEPDLGLVLLSLDLTGTTDQIDRKFGRLLWLSQDLLNRGLRHEIHCLTGDGPVRHTVNQESDLVIAMDALLRCPWAEEGTIAGDETAATWQYHIGGDADET